MTIWPHAWERWLWGDGGVNQRDCGDHLSKHGWWLLSRIPLSVTPRTTHQASLSFSISRNLLKLMSSEWMMPSSRLILYRPLLLLFSILPRPFTMLRLYQITARVYQSIRWCASDIFHFYLSAIPRQAEREHMYTWSVAIYTCKFRYKCAHARTSTKQTVYSGRTNSPPPLAIHARSSLGPIILTTHLPQAQSQVLQTHSKHVTQTTCLC